MIVEKWTCDECGSDQVSVRAQVYLNTHTPVFTGDEDYWCDACDAECTATYGEHQVAADDDCVCRGLNPACGNCGGAV